MDPTYSLALETIEKNKQAFIFLPSRASAEKTAEEISKKTNSFHPVLENSILKATSSPTRQCKRLAGCVRKGIAFHHAGLLKQQRDLIEDEFRSGKIKIICATPTLAAGISLPVFRVIIKSLKRFSGKWGMDWIPVLEYMQMAGRAGRPEFEKFGEAIVIAKDEAQREEIYEKYVCGEPEEIYSKLAAEPVLRMYLLSLISSGVIRDRKSMKSFFAKTFWSHQFKDAEKLEDIMERMLSLLEEWKFIVKSGDEKVKSDFSSALELVEKESKVDASNEKLRPTLIGKRVAELCLDPLTAFHIIESINNYNESHDTFSLLQMISNTLEMRPLLRVKVKEQDKVNDELLKNQESLLLGEPNVFDLEYPEFLNSIKTSMFFNEWINEKGDDYLLEEYSIRPGEIRVKLEIADWLLYAASELSTVLDLREVKKEMVKLRIRVKNGVKEELLTFLKLKGIGRVRARKMYVNGMKDIGDVKKADVTTLSQIIGGKLAQDVKKQLGQKVEAVSSGKRKGQMGLGKF